jgi:hypothetical protein
MGAIPVLWALDLNGITTVVVMSAVEAGSGRIK